MHAVKFGNIAKEYEDIKNDVDNVVSQVLASGWFVLGSKVEEFENSFADYLGAGTCVGAGSGTDAIALALMACDIGPGDEVITVSHTAVPTASAISMVGARPVFVDIDQETCLMDVSKVEAAISPRTRAILPVHLYGQCVDMNALMQIARIKNIPVIEDCAQAHGALHEGRFAGTMGLMGAFSFYPSKNLGCYGDGGAVVTDDKEIAKKLRMLRNYGQRERYHHDIKGINSRLDELQAAILSVKLEHLDSWNARRRAIASKYELGFKDLSLVTPIESKNCRHVFHLYVVQTDKRDELQKFLSNKGIQTLVHYPVPVHQQRAYSEKQDNAAVLPVTEVVSQRVLSLPVQPQLTDAEIDVVINGVKEFAK